MLRQVRFLHYGYLYRKRKLSLSYLIHRQLLKILNLSLIPEVCSYQKPILLLHIHLKPNEDLGTEDIRCNLIRCKSQWLSCIRSTKSKHNPYFRFQVQFWLGRWIVTYVVVEWPAFLQGFEDDEFVIMFLIVPSIKRIKNPLQNSKFPNGF